MYTHETLRYAALLGAGTGVAAMTYLAVRLGATRRPDLGARGLSRSKALANPMLRAVEPVVRVVGRWVSLLPLGIFRPRLAGLLEQAGDFMGLCADELIALGLVLGGLVGIPLAVLGHASLAVLGSVAVGALVMARVQALAHRRMHNICRALPQAIDLAAMCISAGLDFSASLKHLLKHLGAQSPLAQEFARIVRETELGSTRVEALRGFARRVPVAAVQEFVGATVQSLDAGTPLASILRVQAGALRARRSVEGEEAAARAGALMMVPLMLLLASVMVVLFGALLMQTRGEL